MGSSTENKRMNRSVLDYKSEKEIVEALEAVKISSTDDEVDETGKAKVSADWLLPCCSPRSTVVQSVADEAKRLQVLKSYMILDSKDSQEAFEEITNKTRLHYNVPWAVVSLVDMGRQWFKSISIDDLKLRETARRDAFCGYAILQKSGRLVVNDALVDDRFCCNPYVVGAPYFRFYASVSLTVPEGYNIGTLCILDTKPRPNGLTAEESETLDSLASSVVQLLVDRRTRLLQQSTVRKRCAWAESLEGIGSSSSARFHRCPSTERNTTPKKSRHGSPVESCGKGRLRVSTSMPSLLQAQAVSESHPKVADPQRLEPSDSVSVSAASDASAATGEENHDTSRIIQRAITNVLMPDPKTRGVDPDKYLLQLVEALWGVSLKVRPALDLKNFFSTITEEQMSSYNMQVVSITRENDVKGLREYYQKNGRAGMDCFNRFGEGLLNMACRRGFKDIVKFLLSKEEGVTLNVRIRDDYGRTPLHDACWNAEPQLEICTWIMEQDPSLFLIADKRGYTPFQYARKNDWHIWRQFLYDRRHLLANLANPEVLRHFGANSKAEKEIIALLEKQ